MWLHQQIKIANTVQIQHSEKLHNLNLPLNYPNKNKKVQAQFTFLRKTQHNCSGEDREYSQHNGRTHSRVWSVKKMISSVADSLPTHKVNFSWSITELELQIQHNSFSRGL